MGIDRGTARVRATSTNLILVGSLACLLAGSAAYGQQDTRLATPESAFRNAATSQLTAAARRSKVTLASLPIAYAGGEGGFITNGAVEGIEGLNPQRTAAGMDLLFVYLGADGLAVPPGYYKVRLMGRKAQFISESGSVVATLPASVDDSVQAAARPKVHVKLTVSWGKNGPEFDVEITFGSAEARTVSIPIPPKASRASTATSNLPG